MKKLDHKLAGKYCLIHSYGRYYLYFIRFHIVDETVPELCTKNICVSTNKNRRVRSEQIVMYNITLFYMSNCINIDR